MNLHGNEVGIFNSLQLEKNLRLVQIQSRDREQFNLGWNNPFPHKDSF